MATHKQQPKPDIVGDVRPPDELFEIESLNIEDLNVEQLEERLELAIAWFQLAADCTDYTCSDFASCNGFTCTNFSLE